MATVQIAAIDESQPGYLFTLYDGEHNPQPCHISLDLETGEFTAGYQAETGGWSEAVFHQRTLWWGIPTLTAQAVNRLLTDLVPTAQRILDGAEIAWDGEQLAGQFTADADAAINEIADACSLGGWDDEGDIVGWMDAGDWFSDETDDQVAARLGITADTTDEQLQTMATDEESAVESANSAAGRWSVPIGFYAHLQRIRDEKIDDQVDELIDLLEEQAEKIEDLRCQLEQAITAGRDPLIRRLYLYRGKSSLVSSRALERVARVSHNVVNQIGTSAGPVWGRPDPQDNPPPVATGSAAAMSEKG